MEKQAFIDGLQELKEIIPIKHVVSDRHPGINKYMKTEQDQPVVPHYFDCWHVIKGNK